MKDYPSQEELTKVINLCWNAVGNSAAGPIIKPVYQEPFGQQKVLTLEQLEEYKSRGLSDKILMLNDNVCIGLVQMLLSQLCPKAPMVYKNVDDKGY